MKHLGWTTWRDLAQSADASEIAETAMILPLFFMIFLAILWFGQGFRIYGTITRAAREGARAAVAPVCTTCGGSNNPSANAWTAVQSAMQAANLNPVSAAAAHHAAGAVRLFLHRGYELQRRASRQL